MNHHADAESRPRKQIPVDLAQPLVLTIHIPDGNVDVRAVDRPDVLIAYGTPVPAEDLDDDEAGLAIESRGNRIQVRPNPHLGAGWAGAPADIDLERVVGQIAQAFRGGGSLFAAEPGKVRIGSGQRLWHDIAVEIPRSIEGRVEVNSASGDALVEGFTGEIALNTMSGTLRAVRTTGPLVLQTASGDLIVEDASGRLTVHVASGDIRVTSSQIEGFQIQTASGDIHIDATLVGDGPFRAQTANGDVRLTLRRPAAEGAEPAATLGFHTVSGDAHVPAPFRRTGRGRWQSGPGNRGPHIDVTTVSGDLIAAIATAESAFVPAPSPAVFADDAPPAAPPPSDWPRSESETGLVDPRPDTAQPTEHDNAARLAVLEAVERGEIDVEEAMRRLDAEDAVANP